MERCRSMYVAADGGVEASPLCGVPRHSFVVVATACHSLRSGADAPS